MSTSAGMKEGDRIFHARWNLTGTIVRVFDPNVCRYCEGDCSPVGQDGMDLWQCLSCGEQVANSRTYGVRFDGTSFTETECDEITLDQIPGMADVDS
jgi:hypothetical protein